MLDYDKILNFLKTTGPTLPTKVAKYIGTEIFIASAHLSMLASQGKVIISKLKVGGSPLYYLPGQDDQLYQFAAGNINPKELLVLNLLKEEQVLREADLELLAKVALRSLKDFATPLQVIVKGKRELFWSWHLLSAEETQQAIGNILHQQENSEDKLAAGPPASATASTVSSSDDKLMPIEPANQLSSEQNKPAAVPESVLAEKPNFQKQRKLTAGGKKKERKSDLPLGTRVETRLISETEIKPTSALANTKPASAIVDTRPASAPQETKLAAIHSVAQGAPSAPAGHAAKESLPNSEQSLSHPDKSSSGSIDSFSVQPGTKKITVREPKLNENKPRDNNLDLPNLKSIKDNLLPVANEYLGQLNISTKKAEVVRRNAELNLVVEVPSVVGKMEYFCKIRKKQRIDEKDVSAAYMEAQIQKLPLLFLYTGQISNKAEEMLKTNAFSNAVVRKME